MAEYRTFNISRIGESHIKNSLPCQDHSFSESSGQIAMAIVADGHGSRRHFRSDKGSEFACQAAADCIKSFLAAEKAQRDIESLKRSIYDSWHKAVAADFQQNSWTEAELEEQKSLLTENEYQDLVNSKDIAIVYGTTLCAVFAEPEIWYAIQIGDGSFTVIESDGTYSWPMPPSLINEGNRTASLCMKEPFREFRHCMGEGHPLGLIVYTDGIEKTYAPQSQQLVKLLHNIWNNERAALEEHEETLRKSINYFAAKVCQNGDDVSVAGLVDPGASDVEPRATLCQKQQEAEHLQAKITELENTIKYSLRKTLDTIYSVEDTGNLKEQLVQVVVRNQNELARLKNRLSQIMSEISAMETDRDE